MKNPARPSLRRASARTSAGLLLALAVMPTACSGPDTPTQSAALARTDATSKRAQAAAVSIAPAPAAASAAAAAPAPAVAPAPAAVVAPASAPPLHPKHFDLARVVPDDVFLVTGTRHNPEREFLETYWAGVLDQLMQSGVPDELVDLLLGLADAEQRAELDRLHARFAALVEGIEWERLGHAQFVFAERLPVPVAFGTGPAIVSQPDMLFLLRTDAELTRKSHAQLVALLEAAIDEIAALAEVPLTTRAETLHGVDFTVFDLLQAVDDTPELPLSIGQHGDVLLVCFGNDIAEQAAALLAGVEGRRSIAHDPRFQAAFAALPAPEDAFEFVDLQRLRSDVDIIASNILGLIRKSSGGAYDDHIANTGQDEEASFLRNQGYAAYEKGDYERALKLTEAAYEIEPEDSLAIYNIACMHALLGRRELACEWLQRAVDGGFEAPTKIRKDPDLVSLRGLPAYEAALSSAQAAARARGEQGFQAAESIIDSLLGALGVLDYAATVHHTEDHATWSESVSALTEDAPGQPFHAVLAADRPLRPFLDRLPAETVSFSATAGLDLEPLYDFAVSTLAAAGPLGERLLKEWDAQQEEWALDVRADLLGPLGSEMISADLSVDGRAAWVWMLSVEDELAVEAQIGHLLDELPRWLTAASAEAPMLSMLALRTQPTSHADLPGFREVVLGIAQSGMITGVDDGWLIAADSASTLRLMRATAAGEHADLRTNAALMHAALLPDAPALSVSFTDHGDDAAAAAAVLRMIAMMGGMAGAAIPDPDARQALSRAFGMLARLAPVVEAIDFYDSSAAWTTFDGRAWRTRSVTRYVPPTAGG